MAENGEAKTGAEGAAEGQGTQQQTPPKMQILSQFIRDLSFENIVVQKGVQGNVQPDIRVQVALDAKRRQAENQYEVYTKFSITSQNKDTEQTLFLLEIDYGGLFQIENVPEQQLHPFLMIECPRMLFPYVRRIVSDVTHDGGFPPLNLENVDFVQLYRQQLAQRAQGQQGEQQTVS